MLYLKGEGRGTARGFTVMPFRLWLNEARARGIVHSPCLIAEWGEEAYEIASAEMEAAARWRRTPLRVAAKSSWLVWAMFCVEFFGGRARFWWDDGEEWLYESELHNPIGEYVKKNEVNGATNFQGWIEAQDGFWEEQQEALVNEAKRVLAGGELNREQVLILQQLGATLDVPKDLPTLERRLSALQPWWALMARIRVDFIGYRPGCSMNLNWPGGGIRWFYGQNDWATKAEQMGWSVLAEKGPN